MKCPSCGGETPEARAFCRHCGVALLGGDQAPRIGPYRLEAKLGEGGMGVVYRATDEKLHREVAIKILHPHLLRQQDLMERFRREARMHARIIHPNIVTLLSLYEDGEHMALVMEMVHGQNLRDYLRQNPRPPLLDVIRITEAICAGLDAAHKLGVVHRDLKPANVLLATDGAIKLMDFGLAKPERGEEDLTQSGATVGSFRYMAPEQILNQPVDARTDLYALGILMYQMTTGTLPFTASSEGGGEFEIMEKQVRQMPEPPHKLNPSLPRAMSELIMSLLAKDPEDRPASCEVVREALADIARRLERPQSGGEGSQIGWNRQAGGSRNHVEIARGLLDAWGHSVVRGAKRAAMLAVHRLWARPVDWANRRLWPWASARLNLPGSLRRRFAMGMIATGAIGLGLIVAGLISVLESGDRAARPVPESAAHPPASVADSATGQGASGDKTRAETASAPKAPAKESASAPQPSAPASAAQASVAQASAGKTRSKDAARRASSAGAGSEAGHAGGKAAAHPKARHVRRHATHHHRARRAKSVTWTIPHRLVRSDGSSATGGTHEFRGGHKLYFQSLADYALKGKVRIYKSAWLRLYLMKPARISRIVIHRASVGRKSFQGGDIRLEVQDARGRWTTLLQRKDRDIDRPLSVRAPAVPVKGVRLRFKSPEPITIGPVDLLP